MQHASEVQDEIDETFERIDENGDRRISFAEFARLLTQMDHTRQPAALRRTFDAIDGDHDGLLNRAEFQAWLLPQGTR
jgi:Ca2+-binding EF-hand superfamily protein